MAAEHDADARPGALVDDLGHRRDPDRVEARERLVEHEQLGVVGQRDGELDPLLVAVRELLELRLRPVAEAHPLEPARRGRVRIATTQAVLLGEVGELLADPHPRVEAALLGHVAEPQARVAVDEPAVPAHLAAVRAGKAEDAAHRRGLAGAVRPEEPDDAARAGRECRAVERDDRPVALGEVDDFEHGPTLPAFDVGIRTELADDSSGTASRRDPGPVQQARGPKQRGCVGASSR